MAMKIDFWNRSEIDHLDRRDRHHWSFGKSGKKGGGPKKSIFDVFGQKRGQKTSFWGGVKIPLFWGWGGRFWDPPPQKSRRGGGQNYTEKYIS